MIDHITVTNSHSESLTISMRDPEQSGFFIRNIGGITPNKASVNMTDVLGIDGAVFNSAHITYRNIVLSLGFHEHNGYDVDYLRRLTYKHFPVKGCVNIEIVTESRTYKTYGYVESNDVQIFSRNSGALISILCPMSHLMSGDPILFSFNELTGGFEFPFSNESLTENLIKFRDITPTQVEVISYEGTVERGCIIRFRFSDATDLVKIYNHENNQSMEFNKTILTGIIGDWLQPGDSMVINTNFGERSVIVTASGVEYNCLAALTNMSSSSSWITLRPGLNTIWYGLGWGLFSVEFEIEYQNLYEGI